METGTALPMEESTPAEATVDETTTPPELLDISDTAILEYFDVVKKEYEIERNKKQSFEMRAGLVITVIAAISVFLFDRIRISDIIHSMVYPLTFAILIHILAGIMVYLGLAFTVIMVLRTISTSKYDNFEVKSIDEEMLGEERIKSLCMLIFTYKKIIIQHREVNGDKAIFYKKSLYGIVCTILCVITYISF
ncbi:MAG: hypothetical protein FWC16_07170 [Defluviitaleaceae bacterium]|nr:hypothetical protein [Defluviitaleaceae bacterium]MCL2274693.1 hypothetical protein [Defluviitaleaceae bacterium]